MKKPGPTQAQRLLLMMAPAVQASVGSFAIGPQGDEDSDSTTSDFADELFHGFEEGAPWLIIRVYM